jgi:NADH-quinone oxidoreductase subunit E
LDEFVANLQVAPEVNLIGALQEVQDRFGYLPRPALERISRRARIPLSRIYGVVTFYAQFYTEPRGRHTVRCCRGTACHVRGAARMVEEVTRQLQVKPGGTTSDGLFTIECVNCLGACALGPVVVLDGVYYDHMTPHKLGRLIESVRNHDSEVGPDA